RHGQWDKTLDDLVAALKQTVPGRLAIVASARLSNEELYLVRRLAQHLGAPTDCVPRTGEPDGFLLSRDRNPNTTGATLLGIAANPPGSNIPRFAKLIREGKIRVLVAIGEDVSRYGIPPEVLEALDLLVSSDIHHNNTTRLSHFVLPGCAHFEKQGTFTNIHGRVQRFEKAVQPPANARPELHWLADLVARLAGQFVPKAAECVFELMREEIPGFKPLSWEMVGPQGATIHNTT
ncbi:MAG: molybdopterin-dependent oxidoreductase, partial [Verrucomicrobiae bacterium]|nr:molybdopterin-dependent oxidoreductase [Verrucomicrobiae bacterium]